MQPSHCPTLPYNTYITLHYPTILYNTYITLKCISSKLKGLGIKYKWLCLFVFATGVGVVFPVHRDLIFLQNCKQAVNQTVAFPGLSLTLSPISASSLAEPRSDSEKGVADLLRGVGMVSSNYCPTHLQLLQVVDYSTVPLFWISPLQCKLYPQL